MSDTDKDKNRTSQSNPRLSDPPCSLLPCPFCGEVPDPPYICSATWFISCDCGISMELGEFPPLPMEQHWNARANAEVSHDAKRSCDH